METPKTVKAYLKMCLAIAATNRDELKGINRITDDEFDMLGQIRCAVQNDLGDSEVLLEKHGLKYNSSAGQ